MKQENSLSIFNNFNNPQILAHFITKKNNDGINKVLSSKFNSYSLKKNNLIVPMQKHTTNVILSNSAGVFEECDGVFTMNPKIVCSIKVADCMPIYFAHKNKTVYGIIHAGWRGLINGIIKQTALLLNNSKHNLKNFDIIIGPSIQNCCFEIGIDVADKFPKKYLKLKKNRKYQVNLQNIAFDYLIKVGFLKETIHITPDCTFCMEDNYWSYRRFQGTTDRMIGLIGYRTSIKN